MHMIGHQAERIDPNSEGVFELLKCLQVASVVAGLGENHLSVVAPLNDVMGIFR
jgi:hypothetical protein